jgi:hypothetical protein
LTLFLRVKFEQWISELEPNRQPVAADLESENELIVNRQILSADLNSKSKNNT